MFARHIIQQSGAIARCGFSLIPKKRGAVAVTFHTIASQDFAWLGDVLDLIRDKYGFISPENLNESLEKKQSPDNVLLTFDDGFLSNRLVAEELLASRGIKALFFVTEGFIGLRGSHAMTFAQQGFFPSTTVAEKWPSQFDAMDWDDLFWLKKQGHMLGAHTQTHRALSGLSIIEKRHEIIDASDRLEQKLGEPIRYFAYPFGSLTAVDDISIDLAAHRFDLAFSNVRGGLTESPSGHFLFRHNLVPGMPLWLVEAIIEGRLDWRYSRVRRKAYKEFSNDMMRGYR